MAIYRVISRTPFADGKEEGDLICQGEYKYKTLMALLERGRIAPVTSPPLMILPGWQVVAEKVMDIGIVNAVEFIEADPDQIMMAVGWARRATVDRWKDKALGLLVAGAEAASRPKLRK